MAPLKAVLSTVSLIALCACATPPPDPRDDDAAFGESVKIARQRHQLYPDGPRQRWDGTGIDGTAAVESVQRYWESFKAPPPTFVIITPGGGAR